MKKLLRGSALILLIIIMTLDVFAVNTIFKCRDSSGNYLPNSKVQYVTSTCTQREERDMPNGVYTENLPANTLVGVNMFAANYARSYYSDAYTNIGTGSKIITIYLVPKSTYSSLGYVKPLTTLYETSNFGWRVFLYNGSYNRECHRGVDYSGTNGVTPIYSISEPESYVYKENTSSGNYVEAVSNSYTIRYKHMYDCSNAVRDKSKIYAGDIIGYVGNTGLYTTGAHLHIEVESSATFIDPNAFYN